MKDALAFSSFVEGALRAFVAALWLALLLPAAHAADIPWADASNYKVTVDRKDLRELLLEFSTTYGVPAFIADDISGSVTGRFDLTPQSLLEQLAVSHGFTWFFDGTVLYIQKSNALVSEVIPMPDPNAQRVMRVLESLGLMDRRFPVKFDARAKVARVTGPKPYVDAVREALQSMDNETSQLDDAMVRVFRLRYAFAADQRVDDSADSVVPGVATTLSQLFLPDPRVVSRQGSSGAMKRVPRKVPVKGTRYSMAPSPGMDEVMNSVLEGGSDGASRGGGLPQFRADPRMNAIVVRDLPHRMPIYEAAIRSLDVRPTVIEIQASVLEVATDEFDALGLDWRFTNGHLDVNLGRGPLPTLKAGEALAGQGTPFAGSPGEAGFNGQPLSSGLIASTVLGDAGRTLIARIHALQQQGKASMAAKPRLMTLENIEAVINDSRSFYVRVASERDAGLFQVDSGTSLRVRPMVINEKDGRKVKLAIRIEDGGLTTDQVDKIPVVRRTSIGTWALIEEGQSLLIGGFTQEQQARREYGVPVLSSIPVLGSLFKTRENQQVSVERLFMLTPRIVTQ